MRRTHRLAVLVADPPVRSWLLLVALATLLAAGCDKGPLPTQSFRPSLPTSPTLPQPPAASSGALIQGRVIDADSGQPIAGAAVATYGVCYTGTPFGRCGQVDHPSTTMTDAAGLFALNAILPATWVEVELTVTRAGYEPLFRYVQRSGAATALLPVYPTVTIHAGESIHTNVMIGIAACGWLSVSCRRVAVASPNGDPIDIDVSGDQGQVVGLHPNNDVFADNNWPNRLTVSGGQVWVLGTGPVTVTARAR